MRICSFMHVLQVCHADLKLYVYAGLICSCCGFAGLACRSGVRVRVCCHCGEWKIYSIVYN